MGDRFVSPCARVTPYERELLTILIEECAEVQQRATKLLRFGRDEIQPGQGDTNAIRLALEIGDVQCMVKKLAEAGIINEGWVTEGCFRKIEKLAKYMQESSP